MNFDIGKSVLNKEVTLADLQAKCSSEKEKKNIASVFNQFDKDSSNTLDAEEQVALMNFYHSADVSGKEDGKLNRKELRHAKKDFDVDVKNKALKQFMNVYNSFVADSQAPEYSVTYAENGDVILSAQETDEDGTYVEKKVFTRAEDSKDFNFDTSETEETSETVDGSGQVQQETVRQTRNNKGILIQHEDASGKYTLRSDGSGYYAGPDDGIYKNTGSSANPNFVEIEIDDSGREITEYLSAEQGFEYEYEGTSTTPSVITEHKNVDGADVPKKYTAIGDGKYVDEDGAEYTFNKGNHTFTEVKAESTPAPTEKTYTRAAEVKDKTQRIRINYTSNEWRNAKVDFNSDELKSSASQIKSSVTAEEVMDRMLKAKGIDTSGINVDKLKQDLIKNNPSVFDPSTGDVWGNAKWDKLDFPKDLSKYQSM